MHFLYYFVIQPLVRSVRESLVSNLAKCQITELIATLYFLPYSTATILLFNNLSSLIFQWLTDLDIQILHQKKKANPKDITKRNEQC